jgi:DNA-binding NarL/FixJ family response regulator
MDAPHRYVVPTGVCGRDEEHRLCSLSVRELDVLALMAEGLSNGAIARLLHVSERTVEATTAHLFRKLCLDASPDTNRRVLAVLMLVRSRRPLPAAPPPAQRAAPARTPSPVPGR